MSTSTENPAGYSIEEGNAASRNAYNWSKKPSRTAKASPASPPRTSTAASPTKSVSEPSASA
ncbi:hypothetical protein ACFQT0_09240 [Hymenobacter humi]|uniref:Uncharacterized protein n=1 Tax=Hymenobacter humi TaxID=1411620 RepID=A0ABW2U261_9BACT